MSSNYLFRGSEWRIWDLHFHTQSSYDYKDKSISDQGLIDILISKQIAIIAITDHHIIDTVRIKNLQRLGQGNVTVLPGIEFRAELGGSESIHFIGIFSENCDIEDVWIKLQSGCGITAADVIRKGGDSAIHCDLKDTCALIHSLGGIVTVHAGDKSNTLENITNSLPYKMALKVDLVMNHIDILELGKEEDQNDYNDKVFPAINYRLPLILCSDNHDIANYGVKQNLWIKANPTFEGLKQILYEPEDRVKIQEGKPEEKNDYQVIESVQFIDDDFLPESIPLNQNLTAIVGGKSTGKSLLLRSIARTIDANEVDNRLREVGLVDYSDSISGFSVKWRDSQEQSMGSTNNPTKKIIYIPQSYLNRLVDIKEENSSIDEIIKNVLLQTPEVKLAYEDLEQQSRDIHQKISREVDNLFFYLEDWRSKIASIKEVGDRKGVEEEIKKLNIEIQELKRRSGMSESEIQIYNERREEIQSIKDTTEKIDADIIVLQEVEKLEFFQNLNFNLATVSVQGIIDSKLNELQSEFVRKWKALIAEQIVSLKSIKEVHAIQLNKKIEDIKPSMEKLKDANLLNEKMQKFELESDKLRKITKEEEITNVIAIKYNDCKDEIINLYSSYFQIMFDAKSRIIDQQVIGDELEFDLKITFRGNTFQSLFVNQIFDLRKLNNFTVVNLNPYEYLNKQSFENDVKSILNGIIGEALTLKSGYGQKDAVRKLLENWYIFDYIITHNGDSLSRMSPGKKSFVLLKLLIELDDSKCPILLDQPEDDLDNRSIYFDLVSFIKSKKKERQIIVVTHNPNLVVSADAEEIIVANRKGEQTPNNHYEFEYVSGALEDTRSPDLTSANTLSAQGIQEHVCDILEGGRSAFEKRRQKYNFHI